MHSVVEVQLALLELRIRKSMSEGEQRLYIHHVEPLLVKLHSFALLQRWILQSACILQVVLDGSRLVSFSHANGEREPARRIDVSEEHICQSVPTLLSWEHRHHHSEHVRV